MALRHIPGWGDISLDPKRKTVLGMQESSRPTLAQASRSLLARTSRAGNIDRSCPHEARSAHPHLIDQGPPLGIELKVAQPLRDEDPPGPVQQRDERGKVHDVVLD